MKETTIKLFVFLSLISSAAAIVQVNVYVSSFMDGGIAYSNIPDRVNNTPQSFLLVWENTGSIGCSFRQRVDIYEIIDNKTRQVYTSWSEKVPIEPGGQGNLIAYWHPRNSGDYMARTFLYYCNSIENGPTANFTVFKSNITAKEIPAELKTEGTEQYVDFRFNSKEDINQLAIIPRDYPLGWAFESKGVDGIEKGREKTVRVNYDAGIWKERNVSFDIVTLDGKYYQSEEVTLRKKREFPIYQTIIAILVAVILILSITLIRYRKRGVDVGDRENPDRNSRSR